ncbi:MAG: 2-phospho-L-lactate guanylyltransferase [Actinomycetota bacterium]|nr:2-phospho-L-lactate guanylyltransferase [Actinomycetota bacterium]
MKTTAILPVKRLGSAHNRLAGALEPEERLRLAEAMFLDTLHKLPWCKTIDDVIVVTADDAVARQATWLGHQVLLEDEDHGHPEAAEAGARAAMDRGVERVVMLPVDCPLLEPSELDAHLGRSPRTALIVPDAEGTGTNALVLNPPDAFHPAFGPDSCARHVGRARAGGISFALERIESLATDLDDRRDMAELRDALLLNPEPAKRTATVLWELGAKAEHAAA